MNNLKSILVTVCVALLCPNVHAQVLPYQNPNLSAEKRADDLLKRLTLEEKTSLMMNTSPAIPRLGVPEFQWWSEALHGIGRNGYATVFPATIGMAASFDDDLLFKVFTAVSDEGRAKNTIARHNGGAKLNQGLSFWTPNINIFRDPRWGRGQETYGEDPYLTSRMGLAVVRGLQGPKGRYRKLLACAKHFAVHSGPEWSRHQFNIENLPARDLYETYLPAFKALVEEGHVAEIMCAYQRFDGQPCCGNSQLLGRILRDEWHFDGIVTSDCGAISDFWEPGRHGYASSASEASAKAVLTGTDVECGGNYKNLPQAVKEGLIKEADIDKSLKRLLKMRFELGDFDPDSLNSWTRIPASVVASKEHKQLALDMARESIVLLMNKNNILPLTKSGADRIVVMGPNANDSIMMLGNYNGTPTHSETVLHAIRAKIGNVKYVRGCNLTKPINDVDPIKEVGDASIVIFVGGISPAVEGEEMQVNEPGFKGGDRLSIELPQVQRQLIAKLKEAGKKVIFINCSGSAVALEPETKNADAILQAWYGGEQMGTAVADVLFGDYNPGGKLPVTFYRNDSQLPDYEDYRMQGRTYRYFKGEPLFAFGYGLSYTQFAYGEPVYRGNKIIFTVQNVGSKIGETVAQVYLRRLGDTEGPIKSLKAFKRIRLNAGEKKVVGIDFPAENFTGWDPETNTMRVVNDTYELMVGQSSMNKDLIKIRVVAPKK